MDVVVSESGDSFDVAGGPPATFTATPAAARHPRWEAAAREFVRRHPACSICHAKRDLQVHHELPVHLFPAREMDDRLWHVLCRRCHLFVGHLGDFAAWNRSVRDDIATWSQRLTRRDYGAED